MKHSTQRNRYRGCKSRKAASRLSLVKARQAKAEKRIAKTPSSSLSCIPSSSFEHPSATSDDMPQKATTRSPNTSLLANSTRKRKVSEDIPDLVSHHGGCHCGAVRYCVQAPAHLDVIQCNCSICTKKQNNHFIVPKSKFKLIQGKNSLTTYTFNTHRAKHTFCKACGVQSFYTPRSNPDGYGVMPHCLDSGTVKSIRYSTFDGTQWEETMKTSNISERSKEPNSKKQ